MSIPFSNTTTKNGIIQLIERNLGFDDGAISGNSTLLAKFTADVNLTLDRVNALVLPASGTWQFDDSNQTDYPTITASLVSGQRSYSFTTDETGNFILDIYKVLVADNNGNYRELQPIDVQSDPEAISFLDGTNTTGIPNRYDKTANGIFLDPIPDYTYANGLKVLINREMTYFTTSDTTKKAGFAGIFHEYLALRPAYQYAYRKSLPNATSLEKETLRMEQAIVDYYSARERDVRNILSGEPIIYE